MRRRLLIILGFCLTLAGTQAQVYDIRKFGAVGDSATLNTRAIQAAIDACTRTGGQVLIPKGVFLTGTLYLKDKVELHVDEGATLLGSGHFQDYPDNEVSYRTAFTHNSKGVSNSNKAMLFAEGKKGISLTGTGTIDGNGGSPEFDLGNDGGSALSRKRPCLILFVNCRDISLSDLHLSNSAYWMENYLGCDGLHLKGVKIFNHANWNNDGIDIDARNVLIEDCQLDVDDDGICLKNHERDHIVENVVVRNCRIASNCNAIKFGTMSIGGAKNIRISHCSISKASEDHFRHWQQGLKFIGEPVSVVSGIALEAVDGAVVDDVVLSDIVMQDVQTPIFIVLGNRGRMAVGEKEPRIGAIRNLTLKNIKATACSKMASSITGFPGFDVERVTLENIELNDMGGGTAEEAGRALPENEKAYPENRMYGQVYPASGLYFRHVRDLTLRRIRLSVRQEDHRPAVVLDDARRVRITGLQADTPIGGVPVVRLVNSSGVVLEGAEMVSSAASSGEGQGRHTGLRLPDLVSDGMVLQRDRPVNIWGWEKPGEKVTVIFRGKLYEASTNDKGKWTTSLPATPPGPPQTLTIRDDNSSITVKNILFGEVWFCSGQSNMEFTMSRLADKYPEDISGSSNPLIRQFQVKREYSFTVKDNATGKWVEAAPSTVGNFSAVAYYMAKNLYEKYRVPVGIIHSSWGGTPAEAWISDEGLAGFPEYVKRADYYKDPDHVRAVLQKNRDIQDGWYSDVRKKDLGEAEGSRPWSDMAFIPADWKKIGVPGYWEDQGLPGVNGVVWYKKEVEIPEKMGGKDGMLLLGMLDDNDSTWFNGIRVGFTSSKYLARKYMIPGGLVRPGKNTIIVRITDTDGSGGFVRDKPYGLVCGKDTLRLDGEWSCKVGASVTALKTSSLTRLYYQPSSLFDAMIAPLIPYTIRGYAWYQGEANTNRSEEYRSLLPALIGDWRKRWGQKESPFLVVQLANFMAVKDQPSESDWAALRDAQLYVSRTVKNTGLAVTIDLGEAGDVHPLNKRDVGRRLALAAENIAYREKHIVASGPIYRSMKISGNKIVLSFDNCGSGLVTLDGKPLRHVAIAGMDEHFVWAQAVIEGSTVVAWSDSIPHPVAVRYAWADNPEGCNLYNKEGLPASPFRTIE